MPKDALMQIYYLLLLYLFIFEPECIIYVAL